MSDLVGLRGAVRGFEGRVQGCIGRDDNLPFNGIHFEIVGECPARKGTPAWVDVLVDGQRCRINPEICTFPWWRFFDCVCFAARYRNEFPNVTEGMAVMTFPPRPHPAAQDFVFGMILNRQLLLIDTKERALSHASNVLRDGHRRLGDVR